VSEYAASRFYEVTTEHGIRSEDVIFEVESLNVTGVTHLNSVEWFLDGGTRLVLGVLISIRSSKTDQKGVGSHHYLNPSENNQLSTLVSGLTWWANHASVSVGELFFRFKPHIFGAPTRSLTRRDISEFLKSIARQLGLEESGFSSHSLRVGGAESMKQAGVDVEDINRVGRWSTNSSAAIKYRSKSTVSIGALSQPGHSIIGTDDGVVTRVRMEAVMKNVSKPKDSIQQRVLPIYSNPEPNKRAKFDMETSSYLSLSNTSLRR
jgi:hypothetical protein